MFEFVNNLCFPKIFIKNDLNIYKIFWFDWIDIGINYNIIFLFTSFEQKLKKIKFGQFSNFLIVS
jgi:hypothetical protein